MGGLFGGLAGLGQVGSQVAEGQQLNRQRQMTEAEFAQKSQDNKLRQKQMEQQLQQQQNIQWDSTPFTQPDGKTIFRGVNPQGQIVWSSPQDVSPIPKAGAVKSIGKPVLGSEVTDAKTDWRGNPLQAEKHYQPYQQGNQVIYAEAEGPSKPATLAQPKGGGKPIGVIRDNKMLLPGTAGWTDEDQKLFDTGIKSHQENFDAITKRQTQMATARYEMYLKRAIPVYTSDGNLTYSNSFEINKNPSKFAPPTQALAVRNKAALFKDIDATSGLVNDAIRKLPDTAFDPEARAQIALVMKEDHPASAMQNFIRSGFATTLSDEQVAYVTTLASLQESSMAMRSIQGMGAGSDMLRTAIMNMLPGAGTPSKKWAQQQMALFKVEVDSLRTALPNLPGGQGGEKSPATSPLTIKLPSGKTVEIK